MKNSIFYEARDIAVTVGEEVVWCKISASSIGLPRLYDYNIGKITYLAGESRYEAEKGCDYMLVYVEIPDEDGDTERIPLYAECDPEGIEGAGHYENDDGVCDSDDEGAEWIVENDNASEEFLLIALKEAAKVVASERCCEAPHFER